MSKAEVTGNDSKMNLLLLSGSRAAGNLPEDIQPGYLAFAETWIKDFFSKAIELKKPVLFVPYARAGGVSEEEYFNIIKPRMEQMGIELICAPAEGITEQTLANIGGLYIGGGHTYTLLDKLQNTGSLKVIRAKVKEGLPYMGSSAGTIIACPTIKSTNDMPGLARDVIDLRSFGFLDFQLNCHYIDNSMHDSKHQGETRDKRLMEICQFNPDMTVLGLYEGTALRINENKTFILTSEYARGCNAPVFAKDRRDEISCQVGEPKDITDIMASKKITMPKNTPTRGTMFSGLFNQQNEKRLLMQGFNALNMLYISYHYYTNPEVTLTEDGFAFVSSLINFYALSENSGFLMEFLGWLMSAGYSSAILTNMAQGTSQVPTIINLWQALLLNPANVWVGVTTVGEIDKIEDPALAKNK